MRVVGCSRPAKQRLQLTTAKPLVSLAHRPEKDVPLILFNPYGKGRVIVEGNVEYIVNRDEKRREYLNSMRGFYTEG